MSFPSLCSEGWLGMMEVLRPKRSVVVLFGSIVQLGFCRRGKICRSFGPIMLFLKSYKDLVIHMAICSVIWLYMAICFIGIFCNFVGDL